MLKNKILSSCMIFLCLIVLYNKLGAQYNYNYAFNPMRGMVSETERPFRDDICLNGKWQFMPVYETNMTKFVKPNNFIWDDVPIKIPSPWNVNSYSEGDGGDFLAYPSYPKEWEKAQMGWLRKEFTLPANWDGKQLKLHFEAIAGFAKIYINGKLAGENLDIFFPTELDITNLIQPGINEILVGIAKASLTDVPGKYGRRNYIAGSFWGQHIVGIWQDVSLIALPSLSISNVFVNPDVKNDQLTFSVSIKNNTKKTQSVTLWASVKSWEKQLSKDINIAPEDNGVLKDEVMKIVNNSKFEIKAGDSIVVNLSGKVEGKLNNWTPDSPNLYGALISMNIGRNHINDIKYIRFGWRQFTIDGTKLLLNGQPIILKGDSWHFMGIPQMTRRYAWGWFKMLKDINANAVRLHAQPYPSFYLDVADEMGICVLDETGIWSSDGGPKMDSEDYWAYCKKHVKNMVMRDRNHPSVFGWSVCNETLPVIINVFHAPKSIELRQVEEINNWVKIVRSLDPSRDWISGDGEDMRETILPTVIGHYGDERSMVEWSSKGKPWGVGETGMAYYGSPKQISVINGNRAYESQHGRMEGLATEAYNLISKQMKYNAVYTSVFNIIWYGLRPLELGLKDTTHAPKPVDGIFFGAFKEGVPGVQPERLGPYTTTLNPGYDPSLPLYKPWPLFYAVQAVNSTPMQSFSIPVPSTTEAVKVSSPSIFEVGFIGSPNSQLYEWLFSLGVPLIEPGSVKNCKMLVVDGTSISLNQNSKQIIDNCLANGGKVLVWGALPSTVDQLNKILPFPVSLTDRKATSFIVKRPDVMIGTLGNKDLYFTDLIRQPVLHNGLTGEIVHKGEVLLDPCNTDWSHWNRGENIKTASVYRTEREAKPEGAAIVKTKVGNGDIYISMLDLILLKSDGEDLAKTFFLNLGVVLKALPVNSRKALSGTGTLEQAIILGGDGVHANEIVKMSNQQFTAKYEASGLSKLIRTNMMGFFDLTRAAGTNSEEGARANELFLSFWVFSPRSMVNLLVEPDMPKLDMVIEGSLEKSVYVNGNLFAKEPIDGREKLENLPLEKGWNHILICVSRDPESRRWQTRVSLQSSKEEFFKQLKSSVGQ